MLKMYTFARKSYLFKSSASQFVTRVSGEGVSSILHHEKTAISRDIIRGLVEVRAVGIRPFSGKRDVATRLEESNSPSMRRQPLSAQGLSW